MNTVYPVFMTIFKQTHISNKDSAKMPEHGGEFAKKNEILTAFSAAMLDPP
jgi:hypothetical protein